MNLLRNLSTFLFPPSCIGCKKPGSWICQNCKNTYLVPNLPECAVCRRISTDYKTHKHCQESFPLNKVVILWRYNTLAKRLMKKFKYNLRYQAVLDLLEWGIPTFDKHLNKRTLLIPVPSSVNTLRDRGFNQAEIIADTIADSLSLESIPALKRISGSNRQAGHSRKDRLSQSETSFLPDMTRLEKFKNRELCIVDDVCTTGTTIKNCALALERYNPRGISAIALFRGEKRSGTTAAAGAATRTRRTTVSRGATGDQARHFV